MRLSFTMSSVPSPHAGLPPCPLPPAPAPAPAGKELRLLRAKALECVSLVGLAVGKERFG